jgi:hypothetical protein
MGGGASPAEVCTAFGLSVDAAPDSAEFWTLRSCELMLHMTAEGLVTFVT